MRPALALAGVMTGLVHHEANTRISWSPLHISVLAFFLVTLVATLSLLTTPRVFGAHERMLGIGNYRTERLLYFAVAHLIRNRAAPSRSCAHFWCYSSYLPMRSCSFWGGSVPLGDRQRRAPVQHGGQSNALPIPDRLRRPGYRARDLPIRGSADGSVRAAWGAGRDCSGVGAVATQTRSVLLGVAERRRQSCAHLLVIEGASARFVGTVGALASAVHRRPAHCDAPWEPVATQWQPHRLAPLAMQTPGASRAAADVRVALYRMSVADVRERPILGFGPDNFTIVPRFALPTSPTIQANANSSAPAGSRKSRRPVVSPALHLRVDPARRRLLALRLLGRPMTTAARRGVCALVAFLGRA